MTYIAQNQLFLLILCFLAGCAGTAVLFRQPAWHRVWQLADLVWVVLGGLGAVAALVAGIYRADSTQLARQIDVAYAATTAFDRDAARFRLRFCDPAHDPDTATLCDKVEFLSASTANNADLPLFIEVTRAVAPLSGLSFLTRSNETGDMAQMTAMADAFDPQVVQRGAHAFRAAELSRMGGQAKSGLGHHPESRPKIDGAMHPLVAGDAKAPHPAAGRRHHAVCADDRLIGSVMADRDGNEPRDDPCRRFSAVRAFLNGGEVIRPLARIVAEAGRGQEYLGVDHAIGGAILQHRLDQQSVVVRRREHRRYPLVSAQEAGEVIGVVATRIVEDAVQIEALFRRKTAHQRWRRRAFEVKMQFKFRKVAPVGHRNAFP